MVKRELTGEFKAQDSDGAEYDILVYSNTQKIRTLNGPKSTSVVKTLETRDGRLLSRVEQGQYLLEDTLLISDDPNAP